jgi:hypothetical protein
MAMERKRGLLTERRRVLTFGIVLDVTAGLVCFGLGIANAIGGGLSWIFTVGTFLLGALALLLMVGVIHLRARVMANPDREPV